MYLSNLGNSNQTADESRAYGSYRRVKQNSYIVVSPSGKAADFDSVIPWVRFPPPQPPPPYKSCAAYNKAAPSVERQRRLCC